MVDRARARKLAVRIREIVAATLDRDVKDPRLGMVTITEARVTPDLREATVFYTVFGDEEARIESAVALESAKGVVRSAVGRQTGIKHTPSLAFVLDAIPETAGRIEELLAAARAEDARVQELAEGAQPAGDPDPYRVPGERDELGVDEGGSGDADLDDAADEDEAEVALEGDDDEDDDEDHDEGDADLVGDDDGGGAAGAAGPAASDDDRA